jgi:fructosamine-3-kinase
VNHFIKHNHSSHPQSLLAEARGLQLLKQWIDRAKVPLCVPEVFEVNELSLTLNHIHATKATPALQCLLGDALAKLHNLEHTNCGLDENNFIGLNPQNNCLSNNWGQFFWLYRLNFQVDLITNKEVRLRFSAILEKRRAELIDWLNQNCLQFSLLHGDLWAGNVMFDQNHVWLIDPAVYFGDSEVDIAMTEMFGGFSRDFYRSYESIRPLSAAYPMKRTIYNLYHYLNHYNLFGSSYLPSCELAFQQINQGFA